MSQGSLLPLLLLLLQLLLLRLSSASASCTLREREDLQEGRLCVATVGTDNFLESFLEGGLRPEVL